MNTVSVGAPVSIIYDPVKAKQYSLKGPASVICYYDKHSRGEWDLDDYAAGTSAIEYERHIWDNPKFKDNADCFVSFEDTHK